MHLEIVPRKRARDTFDTCFCKCSSSYLNAQENSTWPLVTCPHFLAYQRLGPKPTWINKILQYHHAMQNTLIKLFISSPTKYWYYFLERLSHITSCFSFFNHCSLLSTKSSIFDQQFAFAASLLHSRNNFFAFFSYPSKA